MQDHSSQIIYVLTNPAQAPFKVAYEIFVNPDHKKLAYLEKEIKYLERRSPFSYIRLSKRATTSSEEAECYKRNLINTRRNDAPPREEILVTLDADRAEYSRLKNIFVEKIERLDLRDPLIFYDDKAFRIDIGYGPKEFKAIFEDFTELYEILYEILGVSLFVDPVKYCIQQDYSDFLETEKIRLITIATAEFSKPLPPKKIFPLSETGSLDEALFIKNCMQYNKGLIIGETHEDKSPKQFLIDNMALLKLQGVTTLYMEHMLHECHQKLLDVYLKSPMGVPMPKRLELYLKLLDKERKLEGSATFTNVVKSAKENDIRIVAIDSEATYQMGVSHNMSDLYNMQDLIDRYKAMNMVMLERFFQHNDSGKYIVFIGSGHVSTCKEVPGVSELLGCPNIVIHDLKDPQIQENIQRNVHYIDRSGTAANFDFLYHRNPETKRKEVLVSRSISHIDSTPRILAALPPQKKMISNQEQEESETGALLKKAPTKVIVTLPEREKQENCLTECRLF